MGDQFWFKEMTAYLRGQYQNLHLLRAEVKALEEEKQNIYESLPDVDWSKPRTGKGKPGDPVYRAVEKLQKLDDRHLYATTALR